MEVVEQLIGTEVRGDGVVVARIDMPGRTMNVFSWPLMDALEALLQRVESDPAIAGVVIGSGKSTFLAGADLAMVRGMTDRAATDSRAGMFEHCGRLGRLFLRIEQCAKPWVAAVNGTALGGGLELAMACRARLIDAHPRSLIGVPEVKLGLLPGAGGTQRLPRFLGLERGLSLLLSGDSLSPEAAVASGLFEAPQGALIDAACRRVHALIAEGPYRAERKFPLPVLDVPPESEDAVRRLARAHGISDARLRDYPAYRAIIRCVLSGAGLPMPQANDAEMTRFLDLMFDPVAGNMIGTLFLQRQRVEKAMPGAGAAVPSMMAGVLDDGAGGWKAALERAGIAPAASAALPPGQLELAGSDGQVYRLAVGTADDATGAPGDTAQTHNDAPSAILFAPSEYGRVVELAGPGVLAAPLGAIASRIRALLFVTGPGPGVLQALQAAADMDAQVAVAAAAVAAGRVPDLAALDVAAVVAGVSPAFTGGPCTHGWRRRDALRATLAGRLGAQPAAAWERRLTEVFAQERPR